MIISAQTLSRHELRPPGVHIEMAVPEKSPVFKTGVPVFVGFAEFRPKPVEKTKDAGSTEFGELQAGAPREKWRQLTSWQQFEQTFEAAPPEGFLRHAVRGFFENGGESCVIVPVPLNTLSAGALTEPFLDTLSDRLDSYNIGMAGIIEDIDDIDLVCVPDLMMDAVCVSRSGVEEAQQTILKHCRKMADRFAILDTFPVVADKKDLATDTAVLHEVIKHRYRITGSEGAVYFPWILIHQGVGKFVPPCGHIAGIYARSDAQTGVFKAPANEIIDGAFDLAFSLTFNEQAELNQAGVNCLRSSPGRGIRVWGARTLSVHEHEQFVPIRRLFLTLIRWLRKNMDDLIFESNDSVLRNRIRYRLEGYCNDLFQKGALKGSSPEQAYYIKCDLELNSPEMRESGQVVAEVGLAPAVPAEFIRVRITQSTSGIVTTALSLS